MDANGAPTLSDLSGSQLVTFLRQMRPAGVYSIDKLIGKHGDVTLIWLREHLSADCPWRRKLGDCCGATIRGANGWSTHASS